MWCIIGINVVIGWSLVSGCLCQILIEMKLCVSGEGQQLVVLCVVFIGFVDFDVLFISFVVVVVTFIVFYVVVIGVDVVCCVKY